MGHLEKRIYAEIHVENIGLRGLLGATGLHAVQHLVFSKNELLLMATPLGHGKRVLRAYRERDSEGHISESRQSSQSPPPSQ